MTNVEIPMTKEIQNQNDEDLDRASGHGAAGLDEGDARWHRILSDPQPRAELAKWVAEVEAEISRGQTRPLFVEDL
jgi:hypothetical protein